ncbi:EamA family transporter [Christensenellaceae bacterium OttesenSCG-928-K19]|nr:EamA family transporter [Christensenellaceae bacterium OttesenSCG-928-K19]
MKIEKTTIGNYIFLHVSFIVYSFVGVTSKTAALQGWFTEGFLFYVALLLCILGIYAVLWQQALKKFPLVKAYSNKGVVVIWNLIWAVLFFQEVITLENIIGSAVIILGIMVVSSDAD